MTDIPYTYLGLTNKVLIELNEVKITGASEFNSVSGFHEAVKGYVNDAIESIYYEEDNEWPFQKFDTTVTLVTNGTIDYSLNVNSADIDWDSFYVQRNDVFTVPQPAKKLPNYNYEHYRDNIRADDLNRNSESYSVPSFIIRMPDNKIAVSPPSDRAYTLQYTYFKVFEPLQNADDVPLIPLRYKRAIIEYAKMLSYDFRDNIESSAASQDKAEKIVNKMRRDLIPQQDTVRAVC